MKLFCVASHEKRPHEHRPFLDRCNRKDGIGRIPFRIRDDVPSDRKVDRARTLVATGVTVMVPHVVAAKALKQIRELMLLPV